MPHSIKPPIHPSIWPSLHPSITKTGVRLEQSGRCFLRRHPSAGKEQGMMADNPGVKENTHTRQKHTHTQAYSVPTRLLVGFAESCICILGSRRMCMQMQTMLIVIKGHLPLRSSRLLTCSPVSLSSPLYLALLVSPLLPLPPQVILARLHTLPVTTPLVSSRQNADYSRFSLAQTGTCWQRCKQALDLSQPCAARVLRAHRLSSRCARASAAQG